MSVTITLDDKKARDLIHKISLKAKNMAIPLKAVSNMMRADVLDHFAKEMSPEGKWQPRAQSTIKSYMANRTKRKWVTRKLLNVTGNLRRSVVPDYKPNQAIVQAGGMSKGGLPAGYAVAHNEGLGHLPKREFLWLGKEGMARILKYMGDYLVRGKK